MAGNDVKKLEKMKDDLEAKAIERRRARICRAMEGPLFACLPTASGGRPRPQQSSKLSKIMGPASSVPHFKGEV
ncbi:hypothetical protein GGI1_14119, partial [Acidithiobacillus sp. GGI-221]